MGSQRLRLGLIGQTASTRSRWLLFWPGLGCPALGSPSSRFLTSRERPRPRTHLQGRAGPRACERLRHTLGGAVLGRPLAQGLRGDGEGRQHEKGSRQALAVVIKSSPQLREELILIIPILPMWKIEAQRG